MAEEQKDDPKELQTSPSEESDLLSTGHKLLRQLGEGSYAKVYLTEFRIQDAPEGKSFACKIIDTQLASKEFVEKFLAREIDILVRINHPYIIHVHSIFQRKARYYIFMRLAENGDLLDYLLKKDGLPENHARVWLRQLALALQYLHEMNIAHRDVKCENILVTANYNVKLTDFGFARLCVDSNNKNVLSATYCGSLSYVAPEVLCARPYEPMTADVWSLGVVGFVMLNKAMPFDGNQVKKVLDQQMRRKWKFRPRVAENLSLECKALVRSMIEPDCLVRYKIDQVITSSWMAMDEGLTREL